MAVELMPHQAEVLSKLSNGKVLRGGVGSGKSHVSLAYYMANAIDSDIVVITTAKKRDSLEWEKNAAEFGIGTERDGTVAGTITIDSWNNISKYTDRRDSFFIFDEQRLVGNGAWVKSFQKIVKNGNQWLILTATPGDVWMDFCPVFVANGFFKNKTQFVNEHVVWRPFTKFPQIERYIGVDKLERLKSEVLVEMEYLSDKVRHHKDIFVEYDKDLLKRAKEDRWNVYEDRPIRDVSELFAVMRKIVYSDVSRVDSLYELMKDHPKIIVFYNFNYELDMMRGLGESLCNAGIGMGDEGRGEKGGTRLATVFAEWNGHKKEPIPDTDRWVYLVQYMAGAEGWNCTETDTMVFYSLTYSYKLFEQSQGRIDRINTYFSNLFYFSFFSKSEVDLAVRRSLDRKEAFNERKWVEDNLPDFYEISKEL